MHKGLWTGRATVALLAGLLAVLVPGGAVRAYYEEANPDLAYVPPDSAVFVTVRAADLAGKLGVTAGKGKHPWAVAWQKQFGIPLDNVVRCTLVCLDPSTDSATCLILRTEKPYQRADFLKACVADAKTVKIDEKVFHVSPTSNAAVYFVNDRLVLVADNPTVLKKCLEAANAQTGGASLASAITGVGTHDIVFWSQAISPPTGPNAAVLPSSRPVTSTSSYKVPVTGPKTPGRIVTVARKPKYGPANEATSTPKENQPVLLGFLPFPLPSGVESGLAFVDVSDRINVEFRLNCNDEIAARKAEKVSRAILKVARAELLAAVSTIELAELFPAAIPDGAEDLRGLPTKLYRFAEKGMQQAHVQVDGKTVPVSITIPIDAKTLRSQMTIVAKALDPASGRGGASCVMPFLSNVMPSPVPPAAPTYPTPSDPFTAPEVGPPPSLPYAPLSRWGDSRLDGPPASRATTPTPSPVNEAKATTPATATVKLTVANVRKEPALLFSINDNGKLTFVQKVPPGEAVDFQASAGQRWVAVFAETPAGETFIPTPTNATWLLRPETSVVSWFFR